MKVLGVIPARWASTRLPGKCLIPLCGKPLVLWVWERARLAQRLTDLVVATDAEHVAAAVTAAGGRAILTRADHPSGTDRAAEVAGLMGADLIVNIQGDEPLIDPAVIDALAGALQTDPALDMATAAAPLAGREVAETSIVKVVCRRDGDALYFSRSIVPHVRDGDPTATAALYLRHIGIYAYRAAFLRRLVAEPPCALEQAEKLEQLRALDIGGRIRVLRVEGAGPGVDTPQDVVRAEAALRAAGLAR